MESGIHSVEPKIQGSLGLPYMRRFKEFRPFSHSLWWIYLMHNEYMQLPDNFFRTLCICGRHLLFKRCILTYIKSTFLQYSIISFSKTSISYPGLFYYREETMRQRVTCQAVNGLNKMQHVRVGGRAEKATDCGMSNQKWNWKRKLKRYFTCIVVSAAKPVILK